jgi:hypothetical protein
MTTKVGIKHRPSNVISNTIEKDLDFYLKKPKKVVEASTVEIVFQLNSNTARVSPKRKARV